MLASMSGADTVMSADVACQSSLSLTKVTTDNDVRVVWSQSWSPAESGFLARSRCLSYEGPCLSHLDFCVILLQSVDFCAIYFTTKTLFIHLCYFYYKNLKISLKSGRLYTITVTR